MLSRGTSSTLSQPVLSELLASSAALLRDRQAQPYEVAALILASGADWDPSREPLAVTNRIAETARASLPLACAIMHHCQAALMLSLTGSSLRKNVEMAWNLTDSDLAVRPGRRPSVTGNASSCCTPPDQHVHFVALTREHRRVVSVQAPERQALTGSAADLAASTEDGGHSVSVSPQQHGPSVITFDTAVAQVHGPCSEAMLAQAAITSHLLEAAAWYGALTRLGDALVAAPDLKPSRNRAADLALAEADVLLGATWATIRESALLCQQGGSTTLARHHTARARTLARTTAVTILAAYVPDEFERARRDPAALETRDHLVGWMSRSGWTADVDLIAGSLRREGPSW